jgi:hypothetical protein
MSAAEKYNEARVTVMESLILIQHQLSMLTGLEFNAATLAKHHAAMTKIQMHARKMVEASIDAEVECDIAKGEPGL